MFNQMQVVPSVSSLAALLHHPDFQRGLADAQECFLERYEPAPLTEDQMIEEVRVELTRRAMEHDKRVLEKYGCKLPSYLYCLAFVVWTIDEGLTYAG